MVSISSSLSEAIDEEPRRFIKGLDFEKIRDSKNPQEEFLKQLETRFDKPTGIYLWKFLLNNYSTTNKVYQMDIVKKELPNLPQNLNKKIVKKFYEDYEKRKVKEQEKRDSRVKKPIRVSSYSRGGVSIRRYEKTKGHRYSNIQENFLKSKKGVSIKALTTQFNNAFRTKVTYFGVRDKRLRLLNRKR